MSSPLDALMAVLGQTPPPTSSSTPATPVAPLPSVPPPNDQSPGITDIVVQAKKKNSNLTPIVPAAPYDGSDLNATVPNLQVTQPAPPPPPRTVSPDQYNNVPDLQAINKVQQQYPDMSADTPGIGRYVPSSLPGAGTLRSMLGTLGDAFLISAGKQPYHLQQEQANKIAQASAGFDQDPAGAAARVAATGAPGSFQDAQNLYQTYQNEQLRKATLENTAAYRESVMADRTQNHAALQQQAQEKTDDRLRSLFGARLAAVANNPAQYAATRAAIAAQISKIPGTSIDPDIEFPTDPKQFNNGYGLNANQLVREQLGNRNADIRQSLGQQNIAARYAGINAGIANNNARVGATYSGQRTSMAGQLQALEAKQNAGEPLTPAEQAIWNHGTHVGSGRVAAALNIPGLTPAAEAQTGGAARVGFPAPGPTARPGTAVPGAQQQPLIHTYPSGRKAIWDGRQWRPM